MTVEEIRQQHPDIVQQIEASAQESARTQAIQDERSRLQAIQEIAPTIGDAQMVNDAMYGEHACTAQELALRALQKQAQMGAQHIANQTADFQTSGASGVSATPNNGNPAPDAGGKAGEEEMSEADAIAMITGQTTKKED